MASTALLCYEPLLGYAHDHLFVIIMSATLNDSYLVVIQTENDPVFLIDPDAGKSAEITLQHFNFSIHQYFS